MTGSVDPAARPPSRLAPVALVLAGITGSQVGVSVGASAIPQLGPLAVNAVRQIVAAVALLAIARPSLAGRRPVLGLAVLLGLVMGLMNTTVYLTVDRLGVGLAITFEFLGPLAVALLGSRRWLDVVSAVAALGGVVLLTLGPVAIDPVGIATGLVSAACWGTYIVLNRRLGAAMPGVEGSAIAATVAAIVFAPIGIITLFGRELTLVAIGSAVVAGLLSSAVPYAIDMIALRRVSARMFGLLMSANPAIAALAGLVLLGQRLALAQWAGLALVCAACALALGLAGPARGAPPAP